MSELDTQFVQAAENAKNLPQRPDNETLLQLYSLYKQATEGDVAGKRPGFTDFVGRAKFDAWKKLKGTSSDEAKQAYIKKVNELRGHSGAAGFGD